MWFLNPLSSSVMTTQSPPDMAVPSLLPNQENLHLLFGNMGTHPDLFQDLSIAIPDGGRSPPPHLRTRTSFERGTISPCDILPGEWPVPLCSTRRASALPMEPMQEMLNVPVSPTSWQGSDPITSRTRGSTSRTAHKGVRIQTPSVPQCPLVPIFWDLGINLSLQTTHPLNQRQTPHSLGFDLDYNCISISVQLELSIPFHNISYPRNALHPSLQISFRD